MNQCKNKKILQLELMSEWGFEDDNGAESSDPLEISLNAMAGVLGTSSIN